MITIKKQLTAFWFQLDDADPTSAAFQLRPLTQLQLHGARECMGFNEFDRFSITQQGLEHVLACGLIGWRNIRGEDGADLSCIPANQAHLDVDLLNKIAWEILKVSKLSDEQKKS